MISSILIFLKDFSELMGALSALINLIKKEVKAKEVNEALKKASSGDTSDLERLFNKSKN